MTRLLEITDLRAWYGSIQVLDGVDLHVEPGEIVGLFGHNGAGKSTVVKNVIGVMDRRTGSVRLDGTELDGCSTREIGERGVSVVPQGVGVFGTLTVAENVELGMRKGRLDSTSTTVTDRLPVLKERWRQRAGRLSGGQRQLVSIGRSLVGMPRLLVLDEPSIGLAPKMVEEVMSLVAAIRRDQGTGILLVEQNVVAAAKVIDRGYVLRQGRVVFEGASDEFADFQRLVEFF